MTLFCTTLLLLPRAPADVSLDNFRHLLYSYTARVCAVIRIDKLDTRSLVIGVKTEMSQSVST